MKIRKAEEKDIPRLLALLGQVLQIHAEIRPDIFIPDTTKYTVCELAELLKQEEKPIYVAVDEDDVCRGYAFCQMQEQPFPPTWCPSSRCLLMTFALTDRHGDSTSEKVCLNM